MCIVSIYYLCTIDVLLGESFVSLLCSDIYLGLPLLSKNSLIGYIKIGFLNQTY